MTGSYDCRLHQSVVTGTGVVQQPKCFFIGQLIRHYQIHQFKRIFSVATIQFVHPASNQFKPLKHTSRLRCFTVHISPNVFCSLPLSTSICEKIAVLYEYPRSPLTHTL